MCEYTNVYKGGFPLYFMSLQNRKRARTAWLMHKINEQGSWGLGYSENKLLAEFCLFFGASLRVAPDYLKELESAGKILRKEGSAFSLAFFNPDGSSQKEVFAEEPPSASLEEEMEEILGAKPVHENKSMGDNQ